MAPKIGTIYLYALTLSNINQFFNFLLSESGENLQLEMRGKA